MRAVTIIDIGFSPTRFLLRLLGELGYREAASVRAGDGSYCRVSGFLGVPQLVFLETNPPFIQICSDPVKVGGRFRSPFDWAVTKPY
jgi:hypothetical protein